MNFAGYRLVGWPLALLTLVLCTGCAPAPARKLVGTWVVDKEQQGVMGSIAPAIQMVFEADGAYEISTGPRALSFTQAGTWRFLEANDEQLTVETQLGDGGAVVQLSITIVDDDHIRVSNPSLPGMMNLTFRRAI